MKNLKGNVIEAVIIIIVGVILAYIAIGLATDSNRYVGRFTGEDQIEHESSYLPTFEDDEELACGLTINQPSEYDMLGAAFTVSGELNGCGWEAFEGQAVLVRVFDEDNTELYVNGIAAIGDWQTLPVSFSRIIPVNPIGTSGVVRIQNLDASGENPLSVDIPVFFE